MELTKFDCIRKVIVTSKSRVMLKTQGKVVLEVNPNANKPMIKQAAQELLGNVKVEKVAIINVPGRTKKLKKGLKVVIGDYKKAVVTVTGITEEAVASAASGGAV